MLVPFHTFFDEVGTDEAGRGCLAGPVTAGAIILPKGFKNDLLNDSKQLSKINRNRLRPLLESTAVDYAIAHVHPKKIDAVNIMNASFLAMHRCIDQLKTRPKFIVVDGHRFTPYKNIPFECVIKGDGRFMNIAAASILAKTHRDAYMEKIHEEFPMYNWKRNKGYPTKEHREAIRKFGITKYHRKSFRLLPKQLKFDF